jgi:hypothetical protein
MSVLIQGNELRTLLGGSAPVTKATGTLAADTVALFTIAGGMVVVTSLVGVVTTAITVANSYKLQINPTTGTTTDICAATDIGTADTAAGDILCPAGVSGIVRGIATYGAGLVLPIGQIEHVSGGTDGAITWYATWFPLENGATLVAA